MLEIEWLKLNGKKIEWKKLNGKKLNEKNWFVWKKTAWNSVKILTNQPFCRYHDKFAYFTKGAT